jgi:phospholipid/cholesterol/gamma-HCH transport system substrate-binding protein
MIHFDQHPLTGLQTGADVTMRGVKVGRVEDIAIAPDNINRVDVTVRVDRATPVSDNTVAAVGRNLLTGLARIDLLTPGVPGPELVRVLPGERYPVIAESSDVGGITRAVDRLAERGAKVLDSLEDVLDQPNREAFAATLVNLRDASAALTQRMGRLDAVADALVKSSHEFGRSSRDIAAAVDRVATSAQPVAQQAQVTLRDLSKAVHAFERVTAALAARLEGAVDSGSLEIRATAVEMRATAERLSRAAERWQDPRAMIFGPGKAQLGPGEALP